MHWICSQLGSREHYTIPRVLHQNGKLSYFLTDFWGQKYPYLKKAPIGSLKKMGERRHSELASASIIQLGTSRIIYQMMDRLTKSTEWEAILKRNQWYQNQMLKKMTSIINDLEPGIFFSYSYTALALAEFLKDRGWKVVIGQIDPGKLEEDLVADEEAKNPEFESFQKRAPSEYWNAWESEMVIADAIMVNSQWSKDALLKQGIPDRKINVVPLAYTDQTNIKTNRSYPKAFDKKRPLRVLFLGQINIRKGVHILLDALESLQGFPIEVDFVGPNYLSIPEKYKHLPVSFHGAVPRSAAEQFYADADIFILPTLSDGFAITQLEALSKALPLLVSKNCAELVKHKTNGYQLEHVTSSEIKKALEFCVNNPDSISQWSRNSQVPSDCSLNHLGEQLQKIEISLAEQGS